MKFSSQVLKHKHHTLAMSDRHQKELPGHWNGRLKALTCLDWLYFILFFAVGYMFLSVESMLGVQILETFNVKGKHVSSV